jgi:hypothetical protein
MNNKNSISNKFNLFWTTSFSDSIEIPELLFKTFQGQTL